MTAPQTIDTDALRKLGEAAPENPTFHDVEGSRVGFWEFYAAARNALPAILDDYDRLRAADAAGKARVDVWMHVCASLVAAVSLLKRGGKKAAPSNTMFNMMIADYESSIATARAEIARLTDAGAPATQAPDGKDPRWNYDPSRPTVAQAVQREDAPPPPAAADRGVPGQRVTHIRQSDPYGCLLASVAMVMGQTYEKVREDIGYDGKGFTYHTWQEYLGRAGYAYQMFFRCDPFTNKDRPEWPLPTWADLHLCTVDAGQGDGSHVVVLLRDGTVFDPARAEPSRLSDYPGTPVYMAAVYPRVALATAPKAEDVRREAIEECAKIAEGREFGLDGIEIAERIRALTDRAAP